MSMQALTWILPFRAFLSKNDGLYRILPTRFTDRFQKVPCFDVFPLCPQLEYNLFFFCRYRCQAPSLKVDLIAIGDKCLFPLVFKEAKELRYAANR